LAQPLVSENLAKPWGMKMNARSNTGIQTAIALATFSTRWRFMKKHLVGE